MSTVKSVASATGTTIVSTVKEHPGLTTAALTSTAVIAAALYDYYKNNAKVMKTTVRIAKEFANIVFDKTKSAAEKVAYLVKRNPVLAISAMLGAATITTGLGINYYKNRFNSADTEIEPNIEPNVQEDSKSESEEEPKATTPAPQEILNFDSLNHKGLRTKLKNRKITTKAELIEIIEGRRKIKGIAEGGRTMLGKWLEKQQTNS